MIFDSANTTMDEDDVRPTRDEVNELFVNALAAWDERHAQVGDTIPAVWFFDVLGVTHPSKVNSFEQSERQRQLFMMLFHGESGFRTHVLKYRKRYLKSNYAGGYEVVAPADQTAFAQKQRRETINKALRDEATILRNTDHDVISAKQRQQNDDALAHNVALAKILHRRKPAG